MDIFSTALGMSKQETGFALTSLLVEKLQAEFDPQEIVVYEVFGIPGNYSEEHTVDLKSITIRRFNYADNLERQRSDVSQYIEAIKTGRPVISHPENQDIEHIAIPVPSRSGPLRLIVIVGITENPEKRMMLFQISELYTNMIALHDSHERDQLTSLLNRQTFNHYYERMTQSAECQHSQMFLAIFDIDHFKRVNDTYGHLFGDEVLLRFSQLMERNFRYNDALFRFGGEEFIALIKCFNPECAEVAINRFRHSIETHEFPGVGNITVSAGFAKCSTSEFPNSVIGNADAALYYAKEHGRNQVIGFDLIKHKHTAETQGEIDLF